MLPPKRLAGLCTSVDSPSLTASAALASTRFSRARSSLTCPSSSSSRRSASLSRLPATSLVCVHPSTDYGHVTLILLSVRSWLRGQGGLQARDEGVRVPDPEYALSLLRADCRA